MEYNLKQIAGVCKSNTGYISRNVNFTKGNRVYIYIDGLRMRGL